MLQDALAAPGSGVDAVGADADLVDTTVLLASELCENAVIHAGTEFEVELTVDDTALAVAVTDRGAGPLERHLAQPRRRYGRAAAHGRGLEMVARMASRWGTRHESDGRHTVWFVVDRTAAASARPPTDTDPGRAQEEWAQRVWTEAEQARWLLHVPPALIDRLQPMELVSELLRRLRELLDADAVRVEVDEGDGTGSHEVARDGGGTGPTVVVPLPLTPPLRGTLEVVTAGPAEEERTRDLVELIAYRVAMAVESRWLREVDQRRRASMAYLAETSELLGQSLDVELAVAVVPQVVVPRLGRWCAVHLADQVGRLRLAAITHADENELSELRAVLDPQARPGLPAQLRTELSALVRDGSAASSGASPGTGTSAPVRFAAPTDGLAVALRARGATIGTLVVGRPDGRPHTPEDVVLISDIARRAALAIHNAQTTAAHVAVSQALQHALLPRALPIAPGVEFAAEYLPASTGSDVGGDFYDVLTVDPSHWLVSMGDVCGKGARAAARTGLVRDVLRVLVRGGRSPQDAVLMLNDVMMEAGDPLQYCTLATAMVSRPRPGGPPGLDVALVLAGHLQPVIVRADGTAELVGRFGTAVGLVAGITAETTHHHLAPGDTLLAYTDGVTERRRRGEHFGAQRLLAEAAGAARDGAAQVVAAVCEAVERFSRDRGDDIALLAVRATP
jgi:serine phosphatase RsbU (regulator of sigma subunit)/anti-sigma regulatory factor (Ser/Thr protein kinase)